MACPATRAGRAQAVSARQAVAGVVVRQREETERCYAEARLLPPLESAAGEARGEAEEE